MRSRRGCKGWWVAPLAFGLDRLTKALVSGLDGARTLIPGVVRLRRMDNSGMAFSMLSGRPWLLTGLTALLLAGLTVYLLTHPEDPKLARMGLWLIVGGGAGNLTDRLTRGAVIDFIEPVFVRFAVFNVADVCVCVGAALAALGLILSEFGKKAQGNGDI